MVPEFLVEGRDAPLEVEHVSSVKLLTHVDPHPGVEGSLFHSATSAFLCFIQALGAPRRQLPTHSEFSSPISNLAIGVSSLEGPRGDSSTTISHGEVFWSHPRPPGRHPGYAPQTTHMKVGRCSRKVIRAEAAPVYLACFRQDTGGSHDEMPAKEREVGAGGERPRRAPAGTKLVRSSEAMMKEGRSCQLLG